MLNVSVNRLPNPLNIAIGFLLVFPGFVAIADATNNKASGIARLIDPSAVRGVPAPALPDLGGAQAPRLSRNPFARVQVTGTRCSPARVSLDAGGQVTWSNTSFDRVVIVSDPKDSEGFGRVEVAGFFTHTYSTAGTHKYRCGDKAPLTNEVIVGE